MSHFLVGRAFRVVPEKGHLFKVNVLAFCDGECICLDLENNIIKMGLVFEKLRAASG